MRITTPLLTAVAATLSVIACEPRLSVTDGVAITDVTVVDVATGSLRQGMTVVIRGPHIVSVARNNQVDLGPEVDIVRGDGRFLIPGFWDMHVHTGGPPGQVLGIDFPLYVANGVTGIRLMSGDCADACAEAERFGATSLDSVRSWREAISTGRLVGPRILASSMLFDGPDPSFPASSYAISSPDEGRDRVREAAERGADFVKVYSSLPRDVYLAILDEAERVGIDVAGHVPFEVSITEAAQAGQRTIEHLSTREIAACSSDPDALHAAVGATAGQRSDVARAARRRRLIDDFEPGACRGLFDTLVSNGTWYVPTLVLNRFWNDPEGAFASDEGRTRFIDPDGALAAWWTGSESAVESMDEEEALWRRERFGRQLDFVAAAKRAGVGVLAGTDAWNPHVFAGFSIHDELHLFVEAGLSPLEALQTATLEPARYLGAADSMGLVRAGFLADLVLLERDPLLDISATNEIAAVVMGGRVFPRDALDRLLNQAETMAAGQESQVGEVGDSLPVLVWIDVDGLVDTVPAPPRDYTSPHVSPDGRQIAVMIAGEEPLRTWLVDVETGSLEPFTRSDVRSARPLWSPDGSWIYFQSDQGGDPDIWRQRTDPGSEPELVHHLEGRQTPISISADGSRLIFSASGDIGILDDLDGAVSARILVETPDLREWFPEISPDGRFFAYEVSEAGRYSIHVHEVDTGERVATVSAGDSAGVAFPKWSSDGRRLFYRAWGELGCPGATCWPTFSVDVALTPEFTLSPPRRLFEPPLPTKNLYAVSPADSRFLFVALPRER